MCCLQMHTIDTSRQQRRKLPAPPIKSVFKLLYALERERDSLFIRFNIMYRSAKEGKV